MVLELVDRTPGAESLLKGADTLLSQFHDPEKIPAASAYSLINRLLTFDGRIPEKQAMQSLTRFEQNVLEQTRRQPGLKLQPANPSSPLPEDSCVVIQEGRIGHVAILMPEEVANYNISEPYFIAGTIQFSAEEYQSLKAKKKDYDQDFAGQAKIASLKLTEMEANGELDGVISNIRDSLMRIGPTFVHVGHHLYSTFDRAGKNLIDRIVEGGNRTLSILPKQPVNSWVMEDQIYIYCAHLLLKSGGSARIEEFNGGQVTPELVGRFFDEKAAFYSQNTGEPLPPEWTIQPLEAKAIWVEQKMREVNFKFQRYREINGLIIRQEERILGEKPILTDETVRQNLANRIRSVFGIERFSDDTDKDYWRRVSMEIIRREITPHKSRVLPLPLLIWTIINTAVETTNSDFGMSSTFRDIYKLITQGPLALSKEDFYCCVTPSSRIVSIQSADEIAETSQLMANRMEFNRWHFVPANIERSKIPPKRDWLYAPAIPDITTETDWHHGGHIDAKIHHSLRHPAPITIGGIEYQGAYDIRLLRQSGEPYKPDDIKTAKGYTDALGNVLQTIVDYVEDTNEPLKIDGFTTKWYRSHYWMDYIPIVFDNTKNMVRLDCN